MAPTKRQRSMQSRKPKDEQSRSESWIRRNLEAIGELFVSFGEALDRSDVPATQEDGKDSTFTRFAWFLADEFFNRVRVVDDDSESSSDDGSRSLSESESESDMSESSDEGVDSDDLESDDESELEESSEEDEFSDDEEDAEELESSEESEESEEEESSDEESSEE